MEWNTSKEDQLPFVLCVTCILVVQHQFRKFDKRLTHECYSEVWRLLHGDLASILNIHIQQVVEYADSNGQGEAAYNAVAIYKQATKKIDISWDNLPACAEAIGDKIDAAVGALDDLLQVVPSEVLDLGRQLIAVAIGNESVDEVVIAEKFESQVLTA